MLFYTSTVGISHRTRGLNISAPIKSEVLSDNSMRLRCRLLPPLLRMTEILYLKKRSAARDFALPIQRFFERKRMIFWDNFEFYSITKEDSLPPPLCIKSNYDSIGLSNCLPVSAPVVIVRASSISICFRYLPNPISFSLNSILHLESFY